MSEKPKQNEEHAGDLDASWAKDQQERGYYYDDAHGYKDYYPEIEDEEFDD